MRTRLVVFLAIVIAEAAGTFACSRVTLIPSRPPTARATLPTGPASYLGVYANGSPPAYQPIADFAKAANTQPNLVGYFSGWAQPFATSFAKRIRSHGAVTIVQIDPTFASVPAIAAGSYDGYLRSYADSVRNFGHAVVIGFGHEMNAPWYPGAKYVTWVGIDGYYYRTSDTFARVFGRTIDQVRAFADKPVLLSETAVGPRAGQFVKIADLFAGMRKYNTLGLVWFDNAQHEGIYHQDWRIEDSQAAEAAFRLGMSALTLAHP